MIVLELRLVENPIPTLVLALALAGEPRVPVEELIRLRAVRVASDCASRRVARVGEGEVDGGVGGGAVTGRAEDHGAAELEGLGEPVDGPRRDIFAA